MFPHHYELQREGLDSFLFFNRQQHSRNSWNHGHGFPAQLERGTCHQQQVSAHEVHFLSRVSVSHPLPPSKTLVADTPLKLFWKTAFLVCAQMVVALHSCIPYLHFNLSLDSSENLSNWIANKQQTVNPGARTAGEETAVGLPPCQRGL